MSDVPKKSSSLYRPEVAPVDAEGYVLALPTTASAAEIRATFDRYGFVVVGGVLDEVEVAATVAELWDTVQELDPEIKPYKPSTYRAWSSLAHLGFVGDQRDFRLQACRNRQNPHSHRAFSAVHGTDQLIVAHMRFGLMRPTRQVLFEDGERRDMPNWKTKDKWLHLDMNPVTGHTTAYAFRPTELHSDWPKAEMQRTCSPDAVARYEAWLSQIQHLAQVPVDSSGDTACTGNAFETSKVQGLYALGDTPSSSGGFCCVPGFHRHLREWAKQNRTYCLEQAVLGGTSVPILAADAMQAHVQRIPLRSGSLLIWDSRLPHCNFPNDGPGHRLVQYVKMARASDIATRQIDGILEANLPAGLNLTEEGRKLFGFDDWPEQHAVSATPARSDALAERQSRPSSGGKGKCVIC